ncbi:MAG: hypothetical protein FWE71_01035 [Nocardioidaceae bacterium]|nr:hypothetical protein [Nocardioidaceae bacterium]MCL2612707.1 hypothetical protein [Nocardioidaceae bacterium]
MSAALQIEQEPEPTSQRRVRMTPELKATILEVAESERALDALLAHSARLHQSRIEHEAHSCLICFGAA